MKHTLETLLALAETDGGRQQVCVIVTELVGWTFRPPCYNKGPFTIEFKAEALACWVRPGNGPHQTEFPPAFDTSLDAIMPEVRKLDEKGQNAWLNHMADIVDPMGELGWRAEFAIATAEAIHASIAFILTKQP